MHRIGIIVDGRSEHAALPLLVPALKAPCGVIAIKTVMAHMCPTAPAPVIARAAKARITELEGRGVTRIVILLDREDRTECCGEFAAEVATHARKHCQCDIEVVVKDRMFENWLIADTEALNNLPARFEPGGAEAKAASQGRADSVGALAALQKWSVRRAYDKVNDSKLILAKADPLRIAANSRSFRKFLRTIGHPQYADQSKKPA